MSNVRFKNFLSIFFLCLAMRIDAVVHHVQSVEEFNALLAQGKPVVIDVFTTWCGPCKDMTPVVKELSDEYSDIVFIAIDGDNAATKSLKKKYEVQAYPTFVLIDKAGNVVEKFSGGDKIRLQRSVKKLSGGTSSAAAVTKEVPVATRKQAYEAQRENEKRKNVVKPAPEFEPKVQEYMPRSEKKVCKKVKGNKKRSEPQPSKIEYINMNMR